jgi:hypothetical protein
VRTGVGRLHIPIELDHHEHEENEPMDTEQNRRGTMTLSADDVAYLARHGIKKETGARAVANINRARARMLGTDESDLMDAGTIAAGAAEGVAALSADETRYLRAHGIDLGVAQRAKTNLAEYLRVNGRG